jgi:hypothetical protein
MNKKIFTLALLAVFVLAQFSIASAAVIDTATVSIDALPAFSNATDVPVIHYTLEMPGGSKQNVLLYHRAQGGIWDNNVVNPNTCYDLPGNVNFQTTVIGSYTLPHNLSWYGYSDQDTVEFLMLVVDNNDSCVDIDPDDTLDPSASTFVDWLPVVGFIANPPNLDDMSNFENLTVACNTFEMWGIVTDQSFPVWVHGPGDWGYSGFGAWNTGIAGVFAPPAPVGPTSSMLEWQFTFPATATGTWDFTVYPVDAAGNGYAFPYWFRNEPIAAGETDACADFTDTAANDNELYVRYLASLDLIAGNPDGTYGYDNTLTRAEAAALFEKANGRAADDLDFPTSAPSAACTFTDVTASDWFSGWVWAACEDGFMNGVGGGLFDPSNLLTRGQIVTIFNNIYETGNGTLGSYFDDGTNIDTVLNDEWDSWGGGIYPYLREAAWTDVLIGAYYTTPVIRAYEVGVAEGTSATTFAPDAPISRGLFAKWLYKAISRAYYVGP